MGVYDGPQENMVKCDPCNLVLRKDEYLAHRGTRLHNANLLGPLGMPRGDGKKLPASWDDRERDTAREVRDRVYLGASSEMLVAADLLRRGLTVLMPVSGLNPRYDLVYENGGKLWRAQVKTAAKGRLLVAIGQRKWRYDHAVGANIAYVKPQYRPDDFDVLVIVDREDGTPYYVPNEDIDFDYHEFYIKNEFRETYSNPPGLT